MSNLVWSPALLHPCHPLWPNWASLGRFWQRQHKKQGPKGSTLPTRVEWVQLELLAEDPKSSTAPGMSLQNEATSPWTSSAVPQPLHLRPARKPASSPTTSLPRLCFVFPPIVCPGVTGGSRQGPVLSPGLKSQLVVNITQSGFCFRGNLVPTF